MPAKGTPDGCPAECPTPSCGRNEMPCQDMSTNGCPSKGYCMPFEATSKCNAYCPVNCGPEEMHCPGEEDHMGCKMPDSCIPSKNGDCSAFCPVHCNENEMMCPGGVDGNGCPMPDTCMPSKGTPDGCPAECPTPSCGRNEMPCQDLSTNGCPSKGYCMPFEATSKCNAYCPVNCGPEEM